MNFKHFLILLILVISFSSCHSPKNEDIASYKVEIYPKIKEMKNGGKYKLYAIISPASLCYSSYHWVPGWGMSIAGEGAISVSELREILPDVNIDDDSNCVYVDVKMTTTGPRTAVLQYTSGSSKLPKGELYVFNPR